MVKKSYTEKKKVTNQRYIDEKTDFIAAHLPRGYKDKVNKIAESAGTSKAQVLKNAIDMLYNAVCKEE